MDTYTDRMFRAYVECALWTTTDEEGDPIDQCFGVEDFSAEALDSMRADVNDFYSGAHELLSMDAEQAGHDFWLTRNRHGAGFWDRGLGEAGDELTAMAHPYGESNVYIGYDGLLYVG